MVVGRRVKNKTKTVEKTDRNDYPFVREYGKVSGSHQYYINQQVERARLDKAPQLALFKQTPTPDKKGDYDHLNQASLWSVIDPEPEKYSIFYFVMEAVRKNYGLDYETVKAWDDFGSKTVQT